MEFGPQPEIVSAPGAWTRRNVLVPVDSPGSLKVAAGSRIRRWEWESLYDQGPRASRRRSRGRFYNRPGGPGGAGRGADDDQKLSWAIDRAAEEPGAVQTPAQPRRRSSSLWGSRKRSSMRGGPEGKQFLASVQRPSGPPQPLPTEAPNDKVRSRPLAKQ